MEKKNQIFQNTACSNTNRLRLVPLAVTTRRLSMLCYLWWVSSTCQSRCVKSRCQHFCPALIAFKLLFFLLNGSTLLNFAVESWHPNNKFTLNTR